jgi:hypothetical protein
MPVNFIESLNDSEQWDAVSDFSGGMVSNQRPNLLAPNQSAYLQNMDIDRYGRLETRRGKAQIGNNLGEKIQGIAYYSTPTREELIVAAGGILRAFNGALWTLAGGVVNHISPYTPALFVQGAHILYIAQSDSALEYYNGHFVQSYPDAAVQEVSQVVTTGAIAVNLAGSHFNLNDETGLVSVWFNLDSAYANPGIGLRQIEVAISTGYTATQIQAAITAAIDADAKFSATGSSETLTITCIAGGARDDIVAGNTGLAVSVTQQGISQNNNPPVGISSLVWHTNRLFGAGVAGFPDTVFCSQFLDGSVWDRDNWSVRIGAGDGDAITGLVPWTNYQLIVLKQHSIWVITADPTQQPNEWVINRIHERIGSSAPRTWCQVGTDLFGLTDSGVRTIKNIIASEQQKEVGPALSDPIGDYIDRINPSAMASCHAFHWQNKYILAVPLDDATTPDTILPFNTNSNCWMGVWTNWIPTYFASRIHGGTPKLWFGQSDGTVCDFLDYIAMSSETDAAFKDQGIDIQSRIITRAFAWNEPICQKSGLNVRMEFDHSKAVVDAKILVDSGQGQTLDNFATDGTRPAPLPFDLPQTLYGGVVVPIARDISRYGQMHWMQLEMTSTSKKLAVSTIAASAYIDSLELQTA